jgi:hypothetical protein
MDRTTQFTYDPDIARAVHSRHIHQNHPTVTYGPGYVTHQGFHRPPPPEYQMQPKTSYNTPWEGHYGGDNGMEYTLHTTPQSMYFSSDNLSMASANLSHGLPLSRSWSTPKTHSKSTADYLDIATSASIYGNAQQQFSTQMYPVRSNFGAETNNFSLGSMVNSLPPASPNLRVLPMPSRTRVNQLIPSNPSAENLLYGNAASRVAISQTEATSYQAYQSSSGSLESANTSAATSFDSHHDLYPQENGWISQPTTTDSVYQSEPQDGNPPINYDDHPANSICKGMTVGETLNGPLPTTTQGLWVVPPSMPVSHVRGDQGNPETMRYESFETGGGLCRTTEDDSSYGDSLSFNNSFSTDRRSSYMKPPSINDSAPRIIECSLQPKATGSTEMIRTATHRSSQCSLRSKKSNKSIRSGRSQPSP